METLRGEARTSTCPSMWVRSRASRRTLSGWNAHRSTQTTCSRASNANRITHFSTQWSQSTCTSQLTPQNPQTTRQVPSQSTRTLTLQQTNLKSHSRYSISNYNRWLFRMYSCIKKYKSCSMSLRGRRISCIRLVGSDFLFCGVFLFVVVLWVHSHWIERFCFVCYLFVLLHGDYFDSKVYLSSHPFDVDYPYQLSSRNLQSIQFMNSNKHLILL